MALDSTTAAGLDTPQTQAAENRYFRYHAKGGTLFGIWIVNVLLTILTLGVYHFWGKVRVRDYVYSQTEFDGDRLAYHGTGKELFIGFLKVLPILILIFNLPDLVLLLTGSETAVLIAALAVIGTAILLVPIAIAGAQRYRLSRTSWRGIRFSFHGHTRDFLKSYLAGIFFTIITFGFYGPFFDVRVRKFLVHGSRFGNTKFDYDADGWELFGRSILAIVFGILTLGIYGFWYQAFRQRYHWSHTTFAGARFRSTLRGAELLGLWIVNILLLVFTLGLAWPWVEVRNARVHLANLTLTGDLDVGAIEQEAQMAEATGEEVADFLDLDLGWF